ncbi:polysaccharide deacetylase family protein [Holzapfeliella sp. He02]|uniref:Polysaccharide deacetylase family protein n=1 Tax=Holzapfeliella saturejae TaxID=3082953 RepID=A0ABU8SEK8_9LACO
MGLICFSLFIILALILIAVLKITPSSSTPKSEQLIEQSYPTLKKQVQTIDNQTKTYFLPDNDLIENQATRLIHNSKETDVTYYLTSKDNQTFWVNTLYVVSKNSQNLDTDSKIVAQFNSTKDNTKVLKLSDIIKSDDKSQAAFKLALTRYVFEATNVTSEQFIPLKNQLQSISLDTTDFSFNQNQLDFSLPDTISTVKKVSLAIDTINYLLNSDYQIADKSQNQTPKKVVALTFDDGPRPGSTDSILSTLNQFDIKATFFMLGQNAKRHPDLVKKVKENGHAIGSHSYNHPMLTKLKPDELIKQINQTGQAIYEAAHIYPTLFRPPYGARNQVVDQTILKPLIEWNIDSEDWKKPGTETLLKTIQQNVRSGSIILMHDIHQTTADALPTVINYLKNAGYEFVSIDQLYQHQLYPLTNYYSQHDAR